MKAMLENNIAYDKEFEYFDIQQERQFWTAWYFKTSFDKPTNLPETAIAPPKEPKRATKKKTTKKR